MAATDAAVEEHAAEAAEIVGGGEEPRVPGHAVQLTGPRIVDDSAQHHALHELRGSDASPPGLGRVERGVPHAHGLIEALLSEAVERLAAYPVDELGEHDEARVTVVEGRGRGWLAHARREIAHGLGEALGHGLLRGNVGEAGGVREHATEGEPGQAW